LRAAVGHPPHAECGRVIVRRLFRVPDREDHGVHADNGERVLRWPGHGASMRLCPQNAQLSSRRQCISSSQSVRPVVFLYTVTTEGPGLIDRLDAALIELLAAEPRVGVLEASRRLGVARGTVQARLDRLQAREVITGYGPDISPAALGHGVMA